MDDWRFIKNGDGRTNLDICISVMKNRIEGFKKCKSIKDQNEFYRRYKFRNLKRHEEQLQRLIDIKNEYEKAKNAL